MQVSPAPVHAAHDDTPRGPTPQRPPPPANAPPSPPAEADAPSEADAPPAEAFFALIESHDDNVDAGPELVRRRRTRWAARLTYLGLLAAPIVLSLALLVRKSDFTVAEKMRYDNSGDWPRNVYTPKHVSPMYFVALSCAFLWVMLTMLALLQLEPGPGEKVDEGEDASWVPARDVKKIAPLPDPASGDDAYLSGDDAAHRKSSEYVAASARRTEQKRHRRQRYGVKILPSSGS